MTNAQTNPLISEQRGQPYEWLAENTLLLGSFKPDQGAEPYHLLLQRMVQEGSHLLGEVNPDDPALDCYLRLLTAEARVDLALVEKDAGVRKTWVTEGADDCLRVTEAVEKHGVSGFACSILPRAITILSGAYLAAAGEQRQTVEKAVKKAADLLDEFRIRLAYDRRNAVDKILEGKVFALSAASMPNPDDRRQVLEKAAASLREAAGCSGLAFDDALAGAAEGCLAEVSRSLGSSDLPAPSFPAAAGTDQYPVLPLVCPTCGTSLRPTSRFCKNCGRPVTAGEGQPAPARTAAAAAHAKVCSSCGKQTNPGAVFCPACGHKLA